MKKILLPAVSFLWLALGARNVAVPPRAPVLLPDDTLMMVTIPDFTQVQNLHANTPQLQIWSDPAMKPFRDKFMDKLKSQFIGPMQQSMGIKLDDYTSLPQGQITFAVVQDNWKGDSDGTKIPGLLLLLDTKDKSSQLKTDLADLKKKWLDSSRNVKTEEIRNVPFSEIIISSNDLPEALKKSGGNQSDSGDAADKPDDAAAAATPKPNIYIGQAESLLIVGNSPKVIEKVLAAMSGGDVRTLSQVSSFAANRDAMFRNAITYGWVNAHLLVDIARSAAEKSASAANSDNSPDRIFTALGLDGLKTLAFSYVFTSDGALGNFLIGVPDDNRTGIFKLLSGESKDCTPPAFVPADAVKFQRWRLDGQKTWDGLRKIVSDISPQAIGGLDFMLGSAEAKAKEKDPDFDLKKNLFGNLGDDFITYQKAPRGDTLASLAAPPTLYLVGSPHPEQLANALNALLVLAGQDTTPTSRDFLGRKVYSMPLPTPGMSTASSNQLSYVSSGGYLAITTDTPMLEEYLRSGDNQAKSLRDKPGLDSATERVSGPGTTLFGYADDSQTVRLLFTVLRKDSVNGGLASLAPLAMAMHMGDNGFKDWIDPSLLPDFDQISKYFYFSVYSGGSTPDGLTFKGFAPTPPQLK